MKKNRNAWTENKNNAVPKDNILKKIKALQQKQLE